MLTRKLAIVVVSGLLAGSALAACGDNDGSDGGSSGGGGASAGEGATTITFWQRQFTDDEDAWYKAQVDAYNESQSDVFVDYQMVPEDAWDQKIQAAQASGTAPDVYTRAYNQIVQLAGQKAIADLTDLIPAASWDDLYDNIRDMVSVDGRHYAYPVLVEPSMVLYYRTDLFEQAGLDPADPPTTYDELIAAGEALKGVLPDGQFALGISQTVDEMAWSTWGMQVGLAGGFPISGDWGTAQADNTAYAPLFDFYRSLHDKGIIPEQKLADYVDSTPYGEGKLAMMVCGSWASGELIRNFPDMVANTAVAKMPLATSDMSKPSATLGGWTLVIDAKTEKAQAAADFINWFLAGDPTIMIDYFKYTMFSKFPARQTVDEAVAADPASADANPFRATIAETIVPVSVNEATYPWEVSQAFAQQLEAAMLGTDTASAQAEAQSAITGLIEKLGIAGTGPGD